MRLDLQSLKLFVAVCEHGSIARAAEAENIAPSALSKRMSHLEELVHHIANWVADRVSTPA